MMAGVEGPLGPGPGGEWRLSLSSGSGSRPSSGLGGAKCTVILGFPQEARCPYNQTHP